ncbi:MAG: SsrA-binding protein [Flavobacteriaceae bacterium]|jgi:SsrA-binding protein
MSLLSNKYARSNYEILDTYEAGLSLHGFEVKSLRLGHGSLKEAYVKEENGELFLVGCHIPAYQPKNTPESYDPYRERKLLLKKKELEALLKKLKGSGLTIIPLSVYNKYRYIKCEIALAKGKKKHDKRQDMKKKDAKRDIDRTLKSYNK